MIYEGDALTVLKTLSDESVNCCVTSPPYWGLRDYGTDPIVWGGDANCDHEWQEHLTPAANGIVHDGGMTGATLSGSSATRKPKKSAFCGKCGAWLGSLGLEPTPELFVLHIVEVFREVRRVLRNDGTLWLNLGDSYASGKGTCFNPGGGETSLGKERKAAEVHPLDRGNKSTLALSGLKPKDLCMIPARVALALQADGWWLRSVIIWNKPNPMPESVTDRPTTAHEYIYLLAKSAKYYYDADAIAEPLAETSIDRLSQNLEHQVGSTRVPFKTNGNMKAVYKKEGRNSRFHQDRDPQHSSERKIRRDEQSGRVHGNLPGRDDGGAACNDPNQTKRNKRSVWTVSPQPYKEAHFATFPEKLIEPCILAGCPVDGIVFDPFLGSGTVGAVALRSRRQFVGIELNPEYIKLAERRIGVLMPRERQAV